MSGKISLANSFRLIVFVLAGETLISIAPAVSAMDARQNQALASPSPVHRIQTNPLPLTFIENQGQTDPRVAYYVQGLNKIIYFSADGMTLVLHEKEKSRQAAIAPTLDGPANSTSRIVVKLDFVGANLNVLPRGEEPTPARISYFKAARERWTTGAKTYARVLYANLWPGVDLVYSGTVNRLKYNFIVKPGADPAQIKLRYRGAESVSVNSRGELEVGTALGSFHDEKPFAYQETDGYFAEVQTDYELFPERPAGTSEYGFRLGPYDPAKPLIIDPAVLIYAGFIGGSGNDRGNAIAVDADGNAYITGETNSSELTFPETIGPDLTYNGSVDAFVAKVNAAGTALLYVGYIGGSGDDRGNAIAVDADGNAYIAGETNSSELTFPEAVGPDLTYNGGIDAFVAKVNAAGTALLYAGYIGGSGDDRANGIAVDDTGNAYVTGETNSTELTFPNGSGVGTIPGVDLTHNGGVDAFVAKVNAAGTALLYAGYIGGVGDDRGNAIAVDSTGAAYITGETSSNQATFPNGNGFGATSGIDLTHNGGVDAFVAKVNAAGTALLYAGYIGGSGDDRGNGIAVDGLGNAFITGETNSTQLTFPNGNGFGAIPGVDVTHNGGVDAFVAKVNAAGTALFYAGYIGGVGDDRGNAIALDSTGAAYITGETSSTQATFPDGNGFGTIPGFDLTHNGGVDAFVAKVDPSGTTLEFAAYIGGIGDDRGKGIVVDAVGDIFLTGETNSTETTFPAKTGPDLQQNLGFDAFVAKICNSVCVDLSVTQSDSPDPVSQDDNIAYTITVHNNGPSDATGVRLTETLASSLIAVSATPTTGSCVLGAPITCDLGNLTSGSSVTVNVVATTTVTGTVVSTASVTADHTDITPDNNTDDEKTLVTLSDLIVPNLNAAAAVIPGDSLVISDMTKNNGKVAAGPSRTNFYLSTDNKFDAGDVLLGGRSVDPLAPRQTNPGSTTVTIPPGTSPGNYFLIAVADADHAVAETKDTNKKSRKLFVTRPDLTVSRLKGPSSAAAGASIVISDTTTNKTAVSAGISTTSYFLSANGTDIFLTGRAVPALAPKTSNSGSATALIPVSTPPGNYNLIAVSDSAGAVVEIDESNNTRIKGITITP